MIKVTVMYPYAEDARFDHAYYRDRHMPLVKARLGSACAYYTFDVLADDASVVYLQPGDGLHVVKLQ